MDAVRPAGGQPRQPPRSLRARRGPAAGGPQRSPTRVAPSPTCRRSLSTARPDALRGGGLVARPLDEDVRGDARAPLLALAGAVAFVLLGACANLAGLALARAAARRRDLAVRVALGAGRGRLLRESLAEWAVLAAAGGGLALLVASWVARGLPALFPATIANLALPRVESVPVDGPVVAFALAAALLVSLVAAVVPAAPRRLDRRRRGAEGRGRAASSGAGGAG